MMTLGSRSAARALEKTSARATAPRHNRSNVQFGIMGGRGLAGGNLVPRRITRAIMNAADGRPPSRVPAHGCAPRVPAFRLPLQIGNTTVSGSGCCTRIPPVTPNVFPLLLALLIAGTLGTAEIRAAS